jgi:SAM-dependent methyltransferase
MCVRVCVKRVCVCGGGGMGNNGVYYWYNQPIDPSISINRSIDRPGAPHFQIHVGPNHSFFPLPFIPPCDSGALVGVDLSPKMLAKAEEGGHYTELRVQDANAALAEERPGELDLLLSADTFIYVGALEACFASAARALRRPGGLFAFSIEALRQEEEQEDGKGFRLVLSGRYAHTPAYVEGLAAAHALAVRAKEAVVLRQESREPVNGWIYVLEAAGEDDDDGGGGKA